MTGRFVTYDEAHEAMAEAAVAVTSIGVLADRAVHMFSDRARRGPARQRLTSKIDGTETAAYWVEGVAHWATAHSQARVMPMRIGEVGWPEFLIRDDIHLRVERIHRPDASARRMSRQHQGPDAHRDYMTLFDAVDEDVHEVPPEVTNVDLTAMFGPDGLIEGATISAPMGDHLLWDWDVSSDEVSACIARWRALGSTPWLHDIDRLAAMEPRVTYAAAPLTAVPQPTAGRRFTPTQNTRTPVEAGVAPEEQTERRSTPGEDAPS